MGRALESRLGSRIVLGCKVDNRGKGNEKKTSERLWRHHMYGQWLLTLGNQVGPDGGRGGGGSRTKTEETCPPCFDPFGALGRGCDGVVVWSIVAPLDCGKSQKSNKINGR